MKFGVVVFPGSNCDIDCYNALRDVLDQDTEYIWHRTKNLGSYDCIVLPGGFSYGSYLRGGAIAKVSPVMDRVVEFVESGKPVIGISNGFQVLVESGILPGAFLRNNNMKFICENVYIRTESISTPFTNLCGKGQILRIPIAHGDGNYYVGDETLKRMEENNQIVFRYCDTEGRVTAA
ncbi:MAG: phosphoribosylformylglycinamidine synthase subunit PurQ, partial [Bacillota bacterium]